MLLANYLWCLWKFAFAKSMTLILHPWPFSIILNTYLPSMDLFPRIVHTSWRSITLTISEQLPFRLSFHLAHMHAFTIQVCSLTCVVAHIHTFTMHVMLKDPHSLSWQKSSEMKATKKIVQFQQQLSWKPAWVSFMLLFLLKCMLHKHTHPIISCSEPQSVPNVFFLFEDTSPTYHTLLCSQKMTPKLI